MFPEKLNQKLNIRKDQNTLRSLVIQNSLVDFSSNDYLGFSKSEVIFKASHQYLIDNNITQNGSTGSRLLSGNHKLYTEVETMLCKFHKSEASLVFNSGYDANLGFFSSVPQRGDIILYDEFIHASIRDGIKLTNAKAYKFKHNDLEDLESKCQTERSRNPKETEIYIVSESVFSMDGDSPDLVKLSKLSKKYNAHLVIDEAHAVGVFGENGVGLIQELGLEKAIFARIITFGKAVGCHGAAILGSQELKQYLVNFARSFIYTTALPPHGLASIKCAYQELVRLSAVETSSIKTLHENIQFFKSELHKFQLENSFIKSDSPIHCCVISGNKKVKAVAKEIQSKGFDVKPILSPTVPEGQERLRFCLHSFNKTEDITKVLLLLSTFVNNERNI